MSRSRRKNPITGHTMSKSEKRYKRIWNRYFRKLARRLLRLDPENPLPLNIKKETELWDGSKDGKMMFDPQEHPKLMRK